MHTNIHLEKTRTHMYESIDTRTSNKIHNTTKPKHKQNCIVTEVVYV